MDHDHDDVKMKPFPLSLEDDVEEWYPELDDDSYKTLSEFQDGFRKKWGEKKEPRHLLAALYIIKKIKNETMDEFNAKFRCVVVDLPSDIKPKNASILISYIEAFIGDLRYQLRYKEPTDLKTALELIEKIKKNMQSSGKSNIPGHTRGNNSCNKETKGKAVESEEKGDSKDPMEKVTGMIKNLVTSQNQLMANHYAHLNHMYNRLITMERNNGPRNFQPKQTQMYQNKFPQQEPRIPNQLD